MAEHAAVMSEVCEMLLIDPDELLPKHRHLLELNFQKLGKRSTTTKQYWLAKMKSEVGAAAVLWSGKKRT